MNFPAVYFNYINDTSANRFRLVGVLMVNMDTFLVFHDEDVYPAATFPKMLISDCNHLLLQADCTVRWMHTMTPDDCYILPMVVYRSTGDCACEPFGDMTWVGS